MGKSCQIGYLSGIFAVSFIFAVFQNDLKTVKNISTKTCHQTYIFTNELVSVTITVVFQKKPQNHFERET